MKPFFRWLNSMRRSPTLFYTVISILCTLFLFRESYQIIYLSKLPHYIKTGGPKVAIVAGLLGILLALGYAARRWFPVMFSKDARDFPRPLRMLAASAIAVLISAIWLRLTNIDIELTLKVLLLFLVFWITLHGFHLIYSLAAPCKNEHLQILLSVLMSAVVFTVFLYADKVSSYPYTLDWSEGNRYYNAELFVKWLQSGFQTPLPVLHPSRYLIQSLAFLFSRKSIFFHRLWQAVWWIAMPFLTAWSLTLRSGIRSSSKKIVAILYGYLFLQQGPVYYHLLFGILPLLFWFDHRRLVRSTLLIALGSIWAAVSRLNWYFMPLTVAILFTLFEDHQNRILSKHWLGRAALWTLVSLVCVVGTKTLYQHFSGNPPAYFDTALTSSLLWYRLLPNTTFPPGILLGILIALFPLVYLVAISRRAVFTSKWDLDKTLLIISILVVYFVGSLVVSVKIGGGSNLHNFDSFLVVILVVAFFLLGPVFEKASTSLISQTNDKGLWIGLVTLLIPFWIILFSTLGLFRCDFMSDAKFMPKLQDYLDELPPGAEVLCLSDCQLFTFGYLHYDHVEFKYEKILLMEMAMANNQAYLSEFRKDIRDQRYALIITDQVETGIETEENQFGDENNIWVTRVTQPMMDSYFNFQYYDFINLSILFPKK